MPYAIYAQKHFVAVRWKFLELADLDAILTRVRNARTMTGRDVIYVGAQGDDFVEPDAAIRKELLPRGVQLATYCKSYNLVMDATGVRASLQRAMLRGIVAAAKAGRMSGVEKVRVYESFDALFEAERSDLPLPLPTLKDELRRAEILR